MIRFFLSVLTLVLVVSATSAQDSPETLWTIKTGRALKAHDEYIVHTTYTDLRRVVLRDEGGVMMDSAVTFKISFDALVNVASTTEDGQEKEKYLSVRNCMIEQHGKQTDLLPTGTKIRAWFSDSGSVYTIEGKPAPDSLQALLSMFIRSEGGTKTSDILDPPVKKNRRKVGDSWPVNTKALLENLGVPKSLKPKASGKVKFLAVDSLYNRRGLVVQGVAKVTNRVPAFENFEQGSMTTEADITLVVPSDSRYPTLRAISDIRQTTEAVAKQGASLTLWSETRVTIDSGFER